MSRWLLGRRAMDASEEVAELKRDVARDALLLGAYVLRMGGDAVAWVAGQHARLPNGRVYTYYDYATGAIPFTETAALMTARAPDVAERLTDPLPHGERWCMVLTEHAAELVTFKVPRRAHAIARLASARAESTAVAHEALTRALAKVQAQFEDEANGAIPPGLPSSFEERAWQGMIDLRRIEKRYPSARSARHIAEHEEYEFRRVVMFELIEARERLAAVREYRAFENAVFERAASITPRPTMIEVQWAIRDSHPHPHRNHSEEEGIAAETFALAVQHETGANRFLHYAHRGVRALFFDTMPFSQPSQESVLRLLEERAAATRERERARREYFARIEREQQEREQQEREQKEREAAALRERRNEAPERCASCLRGRLKTMTIHDLAAAAVAALSTDEGVALERRALALTDTVVAIVCDLSHGAAPLPSWFRTELSRDLPYMQRDVVVNVRVTLRAHVALVRPPQAAALAAGADLDPGVFREALALLEAPGPDHTARVAVFYEGRWTVVQSPHAHTPQAIRGARRGVVRVEFEHRERERLLSAVRAAVHRGVMPELIAAEDLGAEFLCNATEDRVYVALNAAAPPWRDPAVRALLDATGRALARFPMGYHETAYAFAALTRAYLAPATVRDLAELARACAFVLDVLTHDTSTGGLAAAEDLARVIRDLYALARATAAQEHPEGPGSVTLDTPLRA